MKLDIIYVVCGTKLRSALSSLPWRELKAEWGKMSGGWVGEGVVELSLNLWISAKTWKEDMERRRGVRGGGWGGGLWWLGIVKGGQKRGPLIKITDKTSCSPRTPHKFRVASPRFLINHLQAPALLNALPSRGTVTEPQEQVKLCQT